MAQSHRVTESSLASMADAVEANLFAFFQHLRSWPRVEFHDEPECCWTISDLPFPLFNSVMRAQFRADRADAVIGARIAECRARRVPMLWWTGPSTEPPDLEHRLLERGFFVEPAHGMALELRESGPGIGDRGSGIGKRGADLTVERVKDRRTLDTWTRVLCHAFGAPLAFGDAFADLAWSIGLDESSPFRHYLARIDGEAAATCSLFFGAGVAGIYDVSTIPSRRKRGLGRSITETAILEAQRAGCGAAILHASSLGAGVYRSIGFRDVCPIGQYVYAPGLNQR